MAKYKNLEQWKEELVGKQFGRLTVIDVQQHIRKPTGKKDGYKAICICICGNKVEVSTTNLIRSMVQSCGCLNDEKRKETIKYARECLENNVEKCTEIRKKLVENLKQWRVDNPEKALEIIQNNVKKAQEWHKEHPEESKKIGLLRQEGYIRWRENNPERAKAILDRATQKSVQWRKKHPEEAKKSILASKQWLENHKEEFKEKQKEIFLQHISKEEKELYNYLLSLGYSVDQQYLLDNHFFDFRVNNFLIEYHGSTYHYTKFENLNNSEAKPPRTIVQENNYHKELRNLAIMNNFHLIQIWDYDWFHRKEFVKILLKEQLSGTADYKDYLEDNNLLNNDYGFIIDGEHIEPKPIWVSTWYRQIVDEEYPKGKVLVYNSGYTKIKE